MPSELVTDRQGAVLVLTMRDSGSLNTLSQQLVAAFAEALDVAESDAEVACVVVRGDGRNFCAGANLRELQAYREPDEVLPLLDGLHQLVQALRVFPKPVLAAVEGAAAGGGFSLALACDLIVAAQDARFALSYGTVGLTPDGGATWQLARSLPTALLQQLVWLAEPVGAVRLHELGLVGWLCDSGQALAEALRVAQRLSAMAPNVVCAGKELVQQASRRSLAEQLSAEREQVLRALAHPNSAEGIGAFLEKRAPRFLP